MKAFDLIIIGGGAGAFATAIKANQLGARTLMINKGLPLGGTCVNVGCVPSKALLWAGEIKYISEHHHISGIDTNTKNINFKKIIEDEIALVETLRKEKYEKVLKSLKNVTFIEGEGAFVSKNKIKVHSEEYSAPKIVIATGSTANVPPIKGIKEVGYLTHIEALRVKNQPKELTIVGAGAVGLEFAQMYSRFGTQVTILQRGDRILPVAEKEITDKLSEVLLSEGIIIKTNVEIESAILEKGKKVLLCTVNGKPDKISGDEVLLAAGKTPNTKKLNLEVAEVNINKKRAIEVNETFQTSQKHIYAVGDVNNLPMRLETTAGREGSLAAENAIKNTKHTIDYHSVPYTVFTDPQISSVGYTEDAQTKAFGVCACRTVSFDHVPKALILRRPEGLIKMSIDPKTKVILGIHILGSNSSEVIAEAMMLIKNKNTIDDVIASTPVFPTMSEAIKVVSLSYYNDISNLSCCI